MKNVIAPFCIQQIVNSIQSIQFLSVATDASNHGSLKLFPILIQFFDYKTGINSKLIYLDQLPNETSETISTYLINTLNKFDITKKCIAFAADNCNTNFGGINRLGEKNVFNKLNVGLGKELIGIGCPVHIIHNAAKHGLESLPFDVEMISLKIFNFFSSYTVRTETLKTFCS